MEKFEGPQNESGDSEKKEKPKTAKKTVYLYAPEFEELVKQEALREQQEAEEKQLETDFEKLAQDIASGQLDDAKSRQFAAIAPLMPSFAHDLLIRLHPRYKGLRPDFIKKVIADYLGDFLTIKREWKAEDLEIIREVIDIKEMRETVIYILKNDCLSSVNKKRIEHDEASEEALVEAYFAREEMVKLAASDIPEMREVVQKLREYYNDIFRLRDKKPSNIVDSLKEGRTFPDINQLLNIREMQEKKKMLIADDMGLGKSASAIFTKEYLGLKCALVVVPSNVEDTWKDYFSDKIAENGKQVGYFKPGLTPKVLFVEDQKDMKRLHTEVFDYVVISQEKMNNRYTEELAKEDFDMMIFDEIHKMKNIRKGKRSENIVKLAKKVQGDNNYLALLSGTPIPNKIHDIAISLKLLYPEKYQEFTPSQIVTRIMKGDAIDLRAEILMRTQMKELATSIEMPKLKEVDVPVELSSAERESYQVLLEEGEPTATEKIITFRKFLLNPELLEIEPGFIGAKIKELEKVLNEDLKTQDKIVVFVNSYIDGVIQGDSTIIEKMKLPDDITPEMIYAIYGEVSKAERKSIESKMKNGNEKMIVFVSGQTADVGVDFSGADGVIFYNEPWSRFEKKQMRSRIYREGLKHDLIEKTLIVKNSIEEGIRRYTEAKEKAIEKLLRGIQNTDLENRLLKADAQSGDRDDEDVETNGYLSEEYLSDFDKQIIRFRENQFIGEKKFRETLPEKGEDYIDGYEKIGPLSYQGNNARATATLIETMIKEKGQDLEQLRILDIASGPEMLKRAASPQLENKIFSLDLNPWAFKNTDEKRKTLVASHFNLPVKDNSIDYCNYAFAYHQTLDVRYYKEKNYERLQALAEMNRTLKVGGRAVITMLYDFEIVNRDAFTKLLERIGFKIVPNYTGEAVGGPSYKAEFITLEKVNDIPEYKSNTAKYEPLEEPRDITALGDSLGREFLEGLEIKKVKTSGLKDQRRMVDTVTLGGKELNIIFNEQTGELYKQETQAIQEGEGLKEKYGGIKNIPIDEIKKIGYERKMKLPGYYLLYKIIKDGGAVIIRGDYTKKKAKIEA